MNDADPIEPRPTKPKPVSNGCFYAVCLFGILAVLFSMLPPRPSGLRNQQHGAVMQQARQIGMFLFYFAQDNARHGNAYPDGKSSTEVFQKLIDSGYVNDPSIFYVPLHGKVPAVPGQKLKPENVCWDVTAGVDSTSSECIPVVFMTGYKITYAPGATAMPVIKPYPAYWPLTSNDWFGSGMALFYKDNHAAFVMLNANNPAPYVIDPNYKPDGHTYRQLTPDGVSQ